MHKKGWIRKNSVLIISFIIVLTLCGPFQILLVQADDLETIITVQPSYLVVGADQSFQVGIYCTPATAMKSFELSVHFDPQMLQASRVSQGTIFNDYETFFNPGIINNDDGEISAIFDLILGLGNVNDPGVLVYITFISRSNSGSTDISLLNCGITNETIYLPLSYSTGTVTIDAAPPQCTDISPSSGTTGDSFTVTAQITDNQDGGQALSAVLEWGHGSLGGSTEMMYLGGSAFETTIVLDEDSIDDLVYIIEIADSYGNTHVTSIARISISDNDVPSISKFNIDPLIQSSGQDVCFSAQAIDNIDINEILLHCEYPNGEIVDTIMSSSGGHEYRLILSFTLSGTYSCSVHAMDLAGNQMISSELSFQITDKSIPEIHNVYCLSSNPLDTDASFGWVNISCNPICDAVSNACVDFIYPDESINTFSLIQQNNGRWSVNTSFVQYGHYTYQIRIQDSQQLVNTSDVCEFILPPNWEINNDGLISVIDLLLVSNRMQEIGEPGWIREDVDNNGIISLADINYIALHYGNIWR